MSLPTLAADKANHVVYGACIGVVFFVFMFAILHVELRLSMAVAIGLVCFVAFAKEASDWLVNRKAKTAGLLPPHGVELTDALATIAGGALVIVPIMVATASNKV